MNYDEMTNEELVKIILENGYSNNTEATLLRKRKEELIQIIKNEGVEVEIVEKTESAKTFIEFILDVLDAVKIARNGKPNAPQPKKIAKEFGNKIELTAPQSKLARLAVLGVAMGWIVCDSFGLFEKIKKWWDMKNAKKDTKDTRANGFISLGGGNASQMEKQ